tara:strand:+ start:1023 stop:1409 length:387 start_codon:yes stop_codon:yes gene_type:complete
MKKIDLNSNRSFGMIFFIFFLIISFISYNKNNEPNFYFIVPGLFFLILGVFNSKLLTPLKRLWIKFGEILGRITSPIILMIIYLGIVFPTNLMLKIFRKDILEIRMDASLKTYWRERIESSNSLDNQF